MRKNFLSKTEYRLSRFKHEDLWVRLDRKKNITNGIVSNNSKNSASKAGIEFRPMRKVLFGLQQIDEEQDNVSNVEEDENSIPTDSVVL